MGALVITATIALAGCSTMPTSGPASSYVRAGQTDPESVHYALVRLTADTERVLVRNSRRIDRVFTDRRGPPEIRFGIGDTVSVTLFESMAGGLFTPTEAGTRQGNYVTLPNQAVNYKGNITVPYGGSIRAAGRTPEEVQNAIVKSLQDRAIEPQAVVALVDQKATSISVLGEVGTPARLPASASGERLLDIITRAGRPQESRLRYLGDSRTRRTAGYRTVRIAAQPTGKQHLRSPPRYGVRIHAAANLPCDGRFRATGAVLVWGLAPDTRRGHGEGGRP
ncbi:polysaccharide biosynthesis/export family protein [Bradyrhizobium elkanii]